MDLLAELAAYCDAIPSYVGFRLTGHSSIVARGMAARIEHAVARLEAPVPQAIAEDVADHDLKHERQRHPPDDSRAPTTEPNDATTAAAAG